MGLQQEEAAALPQLRRSPRRHGSDSELDSTVSTTAGDMTSLNDTCDLPTSDVSLCAEAEASSSFSPFKPKLMRCTSTPANLMHVVGGHLPAGHMPAGRLPGRHMAAAAGHARSRPPPLMPKLFTQPEIDGSSIASSSSNAGESCTDTSDSGFGSTDVSVSPLLRARLNSGGGGGQGGAVPKLSSVITRSRTSSCGLNSTDDSSLFLSPMEPQLLLKRKGRRKQQLATRDISRRWGQDATQDSCQLETSNNHRFTVDSPGLFINRDHLDFVRRLSDKNMSHILEKIWSYLPVSDLGQALRVSSLWNSLIKDSVATVARLGDAKAKWSENAEGNAAANKGRPQRKVKLLKSSPRKALGNVSNLLAEESRVFEPVSADSTAAAPPSSLTRLRQQQHRVQAVNPNEASILTSPSKFRHRLFTDEASRLKPEEQLRPCPRCTNPSRVNPIENRAHCTRISCQFDFCIKCMCEYHGESRCRTTVKVAVSATFKKGRKNLDFSESTFEASSTDLINVTGLSPDRSVAAGTTDGGSGSQSLQKAGAKAAADTTANAAGGLNSSSTAMTRSSRRKLSATVASEKSKSRLKRL